MDIVSPLRNGEVSVRASAYELQSEAAATSDYLRAQVAALRQKLDDAQLSNAVKAVETALVNEAYADGRADEREEMEQDAKRYRWLRDMARSVDWTRFIGENGFSYESHCRIGPDGMDAAIDAAMKA